MNNPENRILATDEAHVLSLGPMDLNALDNMPDDIYERIMLRKKSCPTCGKRLISISSETLLCESCDKTYDIDDTDVLE